MKEMLYKGLFLILTGQVLTQITQQPGCPSSCICKEMPFLGIVTNCSYIGQLNASQQLSHISPHTNFLYLKGNNITILPEDCLNHIYMLHYLHLERNAISDLQSIFHESFHRHLYTLDVTRNKIEHISPNVFPRFAELQSLLLGYNRIRQIEPGNFRHLHQLITLDLSHNRLISIPKDAFQRLHKLEDLRMSGNRIQELGNGVFISLQSLRQLNLSENLLSNSLRPETFQSLEKLQMLELAQNNISRLNPDLFSGTTCLLQIKLDLNKLRSIPIAALRELVGLQYLFLDHNEIREVPVELNLLSNVTALYLTNNKIEKIHKHAFVGLVHLHTLWLSNNRLQTLSNKLAQRFKQMSADQIRLENNPFLCDCQLVWLGRWLRDQHVPQYVLRVPTCQAPEPRQGLPVARLPLENLTCEYEPIQCIENGKFSTECALMRLNLCSRNRARLKSSCLCANEAVENSCKVCPEGSFGRDYCAKCPAFSISAVAARNMSDCLCQAGYTGSPGAGIPCTACLKGTYIPSEGRQQCLPCPTGSMATREGSSLCDCVPGYSLDRHGNQLCKVCPENTYKKGLGTGPCHHCPSYSESPPGSSGPHACQCIHGSYDSRCRKYAFQILHTTGDAVPPQSQYKTKGNLLPRHSAPHAAQIVGASLVTVILLGSSFIIIYFRRVHQKNCASETMEDHYACSKSDLTKVSRLAGEIVRNELYHSYEFPPKKLEMGRLLGQGAFGQVHLAMTRGLKGNGTPQQVAVKSLRASSTPECHDALKRELDQMISVGKHPNIICLLGACTSKAGELMIIMEYAPHGNLLEYLRSKSKLKKIEEENDGKIHHYSGSKARKSENMLDNIQLISFALQTARGMEHLAKMKCVHRDLAARNVLLSKGMVAKVSDFGLAREVYESGYYFKDTKGRLPFRWMSPEALLSGQYTTKSDVWSYGVLLWEMVTGGGAPYPGMAAEQMCDLLGAGYRMRQPLNCPLRLYGMILHCWHESPAERPSFRSLVDKWEKILKEVQTKDEMSTTTSQENDSLSQFMTTRTYSTDIPADQHLFSDSSVVDNKCGGVSDSHNTKNHKRYREEKRNHLQNKVDDWLSSQPLVCQNGLNSVDVEMRDFDSLWA